MKKLFYMLLLLVESPLMAGKTPAGSPQHGAQNPPFDFSGLATFPAYDEVELKRSHATDFKQGQHITSPYSTPLALGTPAASYRKPGLVRSQSDSGLADLYKRPNAARFVQAFGPARAFILAHEIQKQRLQRQESKAQ